MRSTRYVAWLAWRRLTRRDSGAVTTVLGLAVAAAMLAGVLAGVTIATDRATAQAIERIPAADRSLRAVWFGVPAGSDERLPALDRNVSHAFGGVGLPGPTPLVLVRESTVAGRFVGLTAVDGLAPYVILRSGRLPRTCRPEHCEVLRLRGRGVLPDASGLRLVEVGTGTLRSQQLFGDFLAPTDSATADAAVAEAIRRAAGYHRPAPAPLVVAEGRDVFASAPPISRTYRSYAWVWPLDAGAPRLWDVDDLVKRAERARAELATRSNSFAVDLPQEELRAAESTAHVAGRRLLLVGGEVAALLLAFTVLAARGLRRDFEDARRRLTWYGARRRQLWLLTGIESAVLAFSGVLAGWVLGSAVGALAARLAGAPTIDVLRHSVLSREGLALALGAALVSAALIALTISIRPRAGSRIGITDLLAGAALLIVAVALLGGAADRDQLASGQDLALVLLLVPGLVAFAAAVLVTRVFPPTARMVARRNWGSVPTRLAAVGLARGSGTAVVTVGFLTIAFALALVAEGYRATLVRGEREQAAFQVPLDAVVREDLGKLVRVFDAASPARFQKLVGPGGAVHPVLRVTGGAGRAERISGVTVLGLDREPIERLGVWRTAWSGGRSRTETAAMVAPTNSVSLRTLALPGDEIAFRVSPGIVSFAAVIETPDGEFERVELGAADSRESTTLRAAVPSGSRLVTLVVVPPPRLIEGGADAGTALSGSSRLGGPLAQELRAWVGLEGVEVRPAARGVELSYVLVPRRTAYLRFPQQTDATPPAVIVTPHLAELVGGVGRLLPLQIGGAVVPVRIAGVVARFPGAEGETVVGDRNVLRTAINAVAPGAARENEVWLEADDDHRAALAAGLARAPFSSLSTLTRSELESDAGQDPLAHGTLLLLVAAALVSLALAAIGLALAVRSDLRDDRGELYDLEAQGARPSSLRRVVRSRAFVLSAAGLVAGLGTGALLLTLVTRVVSVTARGTFAEPPLVASVDPAIVGIGFCAYAILAAALVGVATRNAFAGERGPVYRSAE